MQGKNHFPEPHQQMLLSSSNSNVQGHILSTGGDVQTEESKKGLAIVLDVSDMLELTV